MQGGEVETVKVYLVGGAVRDQLLELPVRERDWVVVGATSAQMLAQGFRPIDADFPVFLHPESGDEYALARTEEKTGPGYKGFRVASGPGVTLEQDLLRRDLTINALAMDAGGNLIDVCGGREDLDNGLLRHITPAFAEDPVRLLRIARFAAKLGQWGFRVAHGTHGLMKQMAASPDLTNLKAERVWREMSRAMAETTPWRFFEVLHRSGVLLHLMPAVDHILGLPGSHKSDPEIESLAALKRAVALTDDPSVRLSVSLYDAAVSVDGIDDWLGSMRAGRDERQLLNDLLAFSNGLPSPQDFRGLLELVGRLKPQQQPQRFQHFMLAAKALWPDTLVQREDGMMLASEVLLAKPPASFYQQGLQGKALGQALQTWREEQLRERLNAGAMPNTDESGS
ncbi:MAG: rhodanese [Candidatus Thiodiazotropha sp. (ex Myrtea sp. 'scaly one' KF741663)]|nr:rhodanese [Candidatus Thiodiazotropha sp. (ex Myrtea sp. 'scaly one' KF741663)]